jgi:hypothetical protein
MSEHKGEEGNIEAKYLLLEYLALLLLASCRRDVIDIWDEGCGKSF